MTEDLDKILCDLAGDYQPTATTEAAPKSRTAEPQYPTPSAILDFVEDYEGETKQRLRAKGDTLVEAERLEDMLKTQFPNLSPNDTHNQIAVAIIKKWFAELPHNATINIFNITNSPNTTVVQDSPNATVAPTAAAQKMITKRLFFPKLNDSRLNFSDRIILALTLKWHRSNQKKKRTKQWLQKDYVAFTGFHWKTVQQSLEHLQTCGYLDTNNLPLFEIIGGKQRQLPNGTLYMGYVRCEWKEPEGSTRDLKSMLFDFVHDAIKERKRTPSYLKTVLGTSRMTAFRYLKELNGSTAQMYK